VEKKDEKAFIEELVNTFPEIKEEVLDEDWAGLIHLQVGDFMRFTQKAIDSNDASTALKCFQFVDENINKVGSKVENALVISWVFHLNFNRNENLHSQFPSALKEIRVKLEEHYDKASDNEKLNSFLKDLNED